MAGGTDTQGIGRGETEAAKEEATDPAQSFVITRQVPPRPAWRPEQGDGSLALPTLERGEPALEVIGDLDDYAGLAQALQHAASTNNPATSSAALDFCVALRRGGHAGAEAACAAGGVEAAVQLLGATGKLGEETKCQMLGLEAIWFLIDDFDSCQSLIHCGGQKHVLSLARDKGSQDPMVACTAFRVLSETLYGEARGAKLWRDAGSDGGLDFVIEALGWALREETSEKADFAAVLLCDIAALWVQRASGATVEATKDLVPIIPLLLRKMSSRRDDAMLLQHGCRLLQALAKRSDAWPEDFKQPALEALSELRRDIFGQNSHPQVAMCGTAALQAVSALPELPKEVVLSSMD